MYLDEGIGGLILGAVSLQEVKVVSVLGSLLVLLSVGMVVAALGAVDVLDGLVVERGGLGGGNNFSDGSVLNGDSGGRVGVGHGWMCCWG